MSDTLDQAQSATEADVAWFIANPGRERRLRPRFPGEFVAFGFEDAIEGWTTLTVTLNLMPQNLCRLPIEIPFKGVTLRNTDEVAKRIYRRYSAKVTKAHLDRVFGPVKA